MLEVQPAVSETGDEINWRLHNIGEVTVHYGRYFEVQRKDGESWTTVPNHISFTFDLPGLLPGRRSEPSRVGVYDKSGEAVPFEPGNYRFVLTDVHLGPVDDGEDESVPIRAEFKVRSAG